MASRKSISPVQRFEATLEKGDRALGWTVARVPFASADVWKNTMRLRVRGTINGFAFRTSLFPDPQHPGSFMLLVNRTMQKGGAARLGHKAAFTLEPDFEPRPAELPDELVVLLDEAEGLRGFYDELSEYARREIGKWIYGVKSEESQRHRCEQMAERLLNTMEAEAELPPAIEAAFRKNPKARAGWPKLTQVQRRNELMAVFYYQTPEAREKRIAKLCDLAAKKA